MQLTWWQIPYPQALYAGKQNRIITNWPSLGILSGYNQCTAWYMCCVISSVNKISLYNLRKRTFPASDYFHDYWQRETRHRTIFHELNYLVVGEGEGEVELLKTCRQGWVTQGLNLSGYHLCLSHSVSVGVKVIDTDGVCKPSSSLYTHTANLKVQSREFQPQCSKQTYYSLLFYSSQL